MNEHRYGTQNQVSEWAYTSSKRYDDPFNEVELDVVFHNSEV